MDAPDTTSPPHAPQISIGSKVLGVFLTPRRVFRTVLPFPRAHAHWIVPVALAVVASAVMTQVMLRNPALVDQLTTVMRGEMERMIHDGMVEEGPARRMFEIIRPGSPFFAAFSVVGSAAAVFAQLFALGLVFWLLGRSIMKANVPYMSVVEVVGLALPITALEHIVTSALMIILKSNAATPSLALILPVFDPRNAFHVLLAEINAFTLWTLAVVSIGLSQIFQRDTAKVTVLVFALWLHWVLLLVGMSLLAP